MMGDMGIVGDMGFVGGMGCGSAAAYLTSYHWLFRFHAERQSGEPASAVPSGAVSPGVGSLGTIFPAATPSSHEMARL